MVRASGDWALKQFNSEGAVDAEAEAPILWPPDGKSRLNGKDPDAGKDSWCRRRGWQKMRWLDGITDNGHEFEQALGVGDGQRSLVCCSPWGLKESNMIEWPNWTQTLPKKKKIQKKRKDFQTHFMRPALPWYQNKVRTEQEKNYRLISLMNIDSKSSKKY